MPAEEGISRFRTTQLMITSDFEVYHYREPYFKSLDFHSHDFYEAYLFLDGSVTYYIEEQAYDLCAGNLLVIPPGRMHRPVISNSAAVYERMVLWLNGEYLRQLNPDGELLRQLESFGGERGYLAELSGQELTLSIGVLQRLSALGPEAPAMYAGALISVFLFGAVLALNRQAFPRKKESEDLIPQVIRYINEHFTESIQLDSLCARFFISKFHLTRRFKDYTNATIYDYILSKRISLARRLLCQGTPASLVSGQCGFSDYSGFYRAFTAKTGLSPTQFKQTMEC